MRVRTECPESRLPCDNDGMLPTEICHGPVSVLPGGRAYEPSHGGMCGPDELYFSELRAYAMMPTTVRLNRQVLRM
jgi:hypothetical protein